MPSKGGNFFFFRLHPACCKRVRAWDWSAAVLSSKVTSAAVVYFSSPVPSRLLRLPSAVCSSQRVKKKVVGFSTGPAAVVRHHSRTGFFFFLATVCFYFSLSGRGRAS